MRGQVILAEFAVIEEVSKKFQIAHKHTAHDTQKRKGVHLSLGGIHYVIIEKMRKYNVGARGAGVKTCDEAH